ncbi:MAG TPA: hypothetical protein VFQ40_02485 [Actinomycetota bacterium]|nr:hypothetical protein [Actinomycetota bacterium]
MIVAVFKDGTVPVAVAKVIASDHGASLNDYADELAGSEAHQHVELFDVPDGSRFLAVTWTDGWGFTVKGFTDGISAIAFIEDGADRAADEYEPGRHWNITYGDDEGYGHVFRVVP